MRSRANTTEQVGRVLILFGVGVWLVYGIAWVFGGDPQVGHYLPFHLSGVLPGALLARWQSISGWFRRRKAGSDGTRSGRP